MTTSRTTTRDSKAAGLAAACGASGFTLVELLVVATVVACLVVLVVPYARGSHRTAEVREAGLTLARRIEHGRALAAHLGRTARVRFDRERNRYRIEQAETLDSLEFVPAEGLPGEWVQLARRIAFIDASIDDAETEMIENLTFTPGGRWPCGWLRVGREQAYVEVAFGRGRRDVRVSSVRTSTGGADDDQDRDLQALLADPL